MGTLQGLKGSWDVPWSQTLWEESGSSLTVCQHCVKGRHLKFLLEAEGWLGWRSLFGRRVLGNGIFQWEGSSWAKLTTWGTFGHEFWNIGPCIWGLRVSPAEWKLRAVEKVKTTTRHSADWDKNRNEKTRGEQIDKARCLGCSEICAMMPLALAAETRDALCCSNPSVQGKSWTCSSSRDGTRMEEQAEACPCFSATQNGNVHVIITAKEREILYFPLSSKKWVLERI